MVEPFHRLLDAQARGIDGNRVRRRLERPDGSALVAVVPALNLPPNLLGVGIHAPGLQLLHASPGPLGHVGPGQVVSWAILGPQKILS